LEVSAANPQQPAQKRKDESCNTNAIDSQAGMYLITINLLNRQSTLLTEHTNTLRKAFKIPAFVFLPEPSHNPVALVWL
jgi:hypothetical protein